MLTPDKIKEKQFQSSGRGSYRADDVDVFMNEVSASYEKMFKENGDLIRKISILAKKIEEYRADEESLKLALLNAQKLADQIISEAKEKAEKDSAEAVSAAEKQVSDAKAEAEKLSANSKRESAAIIESAKAEAERIIADANQKSNEILGNINRKVTHETLLFDMTKKEATEFKGKLVAMYKEHINLINQLPDIVDEQLDAASKKTAESDGDDAPKNDVKAEEPEKEEETQTETQAVDETDEKDAVEQEISAETPEKNYEDVYSDSAEQGIKSDSEEEERKPEGKENSFKLDLSKIDFSDDDDEEIKEEEPAAAQNLFDKLAEEDAKEEPLKDNEDGEDESSGSVSFKNFFKKK